MDQKRWKSKIKRACKDAGTYKPCFDAVIDTLAGILERRDQALADYDGNLTVEHTNKSGATNIEQNPVIRLINDYNRDALAYWRDLGLTPAGLKRINESSLKAENKQTPLEKALATLNG